MDVITPTIKPSIDALKSILGAARRKWGKRKYEKLLATTFSELLKEHPDLTAAEANLAAAEAVGATPDVNLLRAKSMYGSALRLLPSCTALACVNLLSCCFFEGTGWWADMRTVQA